MNMYQEKALKDNYHEASRIAVSRANGVMEEGNRDDDLEYSFHMLQALRDMAKEGVYPDGHFGDDEVRVWEMFSMLLPD